MLAPSKPSSRSLALVASFAVAVGVVVGLPAPARAATFTVVNTNDSGEGSLRDAIAAANEVPGQDLIAFDIEGPGPHTISLSTSASTVFALPVITEAVTIDATTEPDHVDQPVVELVGQGSEGGASAFWVESSDVTISGLSVRNFRQGVTVTGTGSQATISSNQFGVTADGESPSGVYQEYAVGLFGGTGSDVAGNLIGNAAIGVRVSGTTTIDSAIYGNSIGLDHNQEQALDVHEGVVFAGAGPTHGVSGNRIAGGPTSSAGITISDTDGVDMVENTIGGSSALDQPFPGRLLGGVVLGGGTTNVNLRYNEISNGYGPGVRVSATSPVTGTIESNWISGNTEAGVRVSGPPAFVTLTRNTLYDNGGLGVDVAPDDVNEAPDAGPEILDITPVSNEGTDFLLRFDGRAEWANEIRSVEFYTNFECDPSGFGEGSNYVGSAEITLDESGNALESVQVPFGAFPGDLITALISGGADHLPTEFSNCVTVGGDENTPPRAQSADVVTTPADTAVDITLRGSDADNDPLTFAINQVPTTGSVGEIGPVTCGDGLCEADVTYTPAPGFSGDDEFSFTVNDGKATSESAVVDVTVTPEPGALADLALTLADTPDPVSSGAAVAYIATIRNLGPVAATGTEVVFQEPETAQLPSGTSFLFGSFTSSSGAEGSCAQTVTGAVKCDLGEGSLEPSTTATWTATVVLQTDSETLGPVTVEATVTADQDDPAGGNNSATESTAISPVGTGEASAYIPPGAPPTTIGTAELVTFGNLSVPIADSGDTTAAAITVPARGPGGTVTVAELECLAPFCPTEVPFADGRGGQPGEVIDNSVIEFVPPSDPYYNYRHRIRYQVVYDASVASGVRPRRATVVYTKDDDPETLVTAQRCVRPFTSSSVFPCVKSLWFLRKAPDERLRGDLRLVVLGTSVDPKIAGRR